MRILVLGAGGTGGYFGGRLHEGGADVTFLVREKRARHIATHGLQLESPKGNATFRVKTLLAPDVKPTYDIVLLSCKAYDLASSIDAIRPAMNATTSIVPLLNGISHIDTLDAAFGKLRVMGGTAQIAATLTKDGVVKSMADVQLITWGAREPSQQAAADALGQAFAKTSVDWKVSDDIMQDMWEKVAFLSTLAGMTCLMRGSVGEIIDTQEGATMIKRYMNSCIGVAGRSGYAPRPAAIARYEKVLTTPGSTFTASMLRDLESGGAVEADHIVGFMLKKAREFGVDDTMLSVAYAHLKAYENRRAGNRLPRSAS
jgi:2-dehydropantoate 2-reductase